MLKAESLPARSLVWSAKPGPEGIIPLKKGGGGLLGGVTVNAPITINGPVSDSGNLAAILSEHAREIARQVSRRLRSSTNGKRSSERLRRCP
jgi:hypothetical protein